jgi:hypothetical protein
VNFANVVVVADAVAVEDAGNFADVVSVAD